MSCRSVCVESSNVYRSVKPPARADRAMEVPSGDQLAESTWPNSLKTNSRSCPPSFIAISISAAWPCRTAGNTNHSPFGLQAPDERNACRLSKRALAAVVASLRTMRPVGTSARKRSIDSRSRSEKKTACLPSGLSAGPSCMPPRLHSVTGSEPRDAPYVCCTLAYQSACSVSRSCPVAYRIRSLTFRCFLSGFSAFSTTSSPNR